MVQPCFALGIESIEDLAAQTEMPYGTVSDSAPETFFFTHQDPVYRIVASHMKQHDTNVKTTFEGISKVINGHGKTKGKFYL